MKIYIQKIKDAVGLFLIPFFVPSLVHAQNKSAGDIRNLQAGDIPGLVTNIAKFINSWLIPMFILLALAYFLVGVVQYIGTSDDTKKEEKKTRMFWGLIALFVMLSVWSLVFVIKNTFGISTGTNSDFWSMVE